MHFESKSQSDLLVFIVRCAANEASAAFTLDWHRRRCFEYLKYLKLVGESAKKINAHRNNFQIDLCNVHKRFPVRFPVSKFRFGWLNDAKSEILIIRTARKLNYLLRSSVNVKRPWIISRDDNGAGKTHTYFHEKYSFLQNISSSRSGHLLSPASRKQTITNRLIANLLSAMNAGTMIVVGRTSMFAWFH